MIIDAILYLAAAAYVLGALVLIVFVGSFGVLLAIYWMIRRESPQLPVVPTADLPAITIQLPVFNEAHVIERLLDACARLDYPPGQLHIQVIDDSTDETTRLIRQRIAYWQDRGVSYIDLLRRPARSGYKAGALAYGLSQTTTDYIAVFDADFIPPRDFLHRTVPYFTANPNLALVQTRWNHLNRNTNGLTRAQALTMDGHFIVEQTARNRGQLPMSMNGTGGLWRVAALHDAGGWSSDTITEDLDLSYRALLRGWEFLYLPDVTVPGELPPQVQAYKIQQRRWATGMTENLIKNAIPLLRSRRYSPGKKLMGLAHLAQYAIQPLILLLFVLTPLLLWGDMFPRMPNLGPLFGAVGLIAPAIMITAQWEIGGNWMQRLLAFPVQFIIGAAAVLNNTWGVLNGLHRPGVEREFKRTPKFRLMQ
ncbi:MAG: glycosyltransferase, partial [Anaerolineae bacterium]|nr:glycosyltransferase [Anaerolineae bacterium]